MKSLIIPSVSNRRQRNVVRRSKIARAAFEALEDRRLMSITLFADTTFDALDAADDDGLSGTVKVDAGDLDVNGFKITNSDGSAIFFDIAGNLNMLDAGSQITNNDDVPPQINDDSAGNISFAIGGNLDIGFGSGIYAENRITGGSGGNISIGSVATPVGGDVHLFDGATISTRKITGSGDTGHAGDITIVAENITTDDGSLITAGGLTEGNAGPDADQDKGPAGNILLQANFDIDIDGHVYSISRMSGTGAVQPPGGGSIKIVAAVSNVDGDVTISDTGRVVSANFGLGDAGAGLVHIEGCAVTIYGYVASTGAGHALPNTPPTELNGECQPDIDNDDSNTAGIEVWAHDGILIDSTGTHNGELNADLTKGENNDTFIVLYSAGPIDIIGDTTGPFAVHATNAGSGAAGGTIIIKSTEGAITATGLAIDAHSNGSNSTSGGFVDIQALQDVILNGATILAQDQNGVSGGSILARSYAGKLEWTSGLGSVGPNGTITLEYFTTATLGATFLGTAVPVVATFNGSGGAPVLPPCVELPECEHAPLLLDFGDNPDPLDLTPGAYPTLLANLGPRHIVQADDGFVNGYFLGERVDTEVDGQPDINAKGDDNNSTLIPPGAGSAGADDEDGLPDLESDMSFFPGKVNASTKVVASKAGVLNAWVDWNRDGDFDDTGEQIANMVNLVAGDNTLIFDIPATAVGDADGETTYTRWRFSDDGKTPDDLSNLTYTGLSDTGEVEDHLITLYAIIKCAVINQVGSVRVAGSNLVFGSGASGASFAAVGPVYTPYATPDIVVDIQGGPAGFNLNNLDSWVPATNSIQAALDYIVGVNGVGGHSDVNGDGKLYIAVVAKDNIIGTTAAGYPVIARDLGGGGVGNIVITNPYSQMLYVVGNSVNLTAADVSKPVITVKNSVGKVTLMDVHAYGSNVDGVLVTNNASYVLVKNTDAVNNKGAGIHIIDNNVEVRGSQRIIGNGTGILAEGTAIVLSTNNITKSTGWGIKILGGSNETSNNDVGVSGAGNALGGIYVEGSSNKLADDNVLYNLGAGIVLVGNSNYAKGEDVMNNKGAGYKVTGNTNKLEQNNIFSNVGIGIDIIGNTNTLLKNLVGDKGKGNTGDGVRLNGASNIVQENQVYANSGYGFNVTGGTSATYNTFKSNQSGKSGAINTLAAYHFVTAAIKDLGSNKKNGVAVTLGTFVTSKDF